MKSWKTWARACGKLSTSFLCAVSMAAQSAPMFRASVALVHVDAEVTLDGRTLSGLTKDDFRVFDEQRPQTVVHFASEQEPLDLILLFDFSNSMRPVVQSVAAAARQGLQDCVRATASAYGSSTGAARRSPRLPATSTPWRGPLSKRFPIRVLQAALGFERPWMRRRCGS